MLMFCLEKLSDAWWISPLRWPRIFTTYWSTMDTSWTVEVWSRWKGRVRWPLTSSPAALRAGSVRRGDHSLTPSGLAEAETAETPDGQHQDEQWGTARTGADDGRRRPAVPVCVLSSSHMLTRRICPRPKPPPPPHPTPMLLERSQSPVALEWKWQCFSLRAIRAFHLESLFIFTQIGCFVFFVSILVLSTKYVYLNTGKCVLKICKDCMKVVAKT